MTDAQIREQSARGRGRPALPAEEKTVNGSIRLTPSRWAKLRRLGNAWLSKMIDRAKEPEKPKV
jgi:hypothetical protein